MRDGVLEFELLYVDGCNAWHQALENLRRALRQERMGMSVSLVRVTSHLQAEALQFRGSPSIRTAGGDLFPDSAREYSLSCRLYIHNGKVAGWPTVYMISSRLRAILQERQDGRALHMSAASSSRQE